VPEKARPKEISQNAGLDYCLRRNDEGHSTESDKDFCKHPHHTESHFLIIIFVFGVEGKSEYFKHRHLPEADMSNRFRVNFLVKHRADNLQDLAYVVRLVDKPFCP
jgi:hypothetical protein